MISRRLIASASRARFANTIISRQMHQSSHAEFPSILSAVSSPSAMSRQPVVLHKMKKFTPMQLTCNFQTTPPKQDAPTLIILPQMTEPQPVEVMNIPRINHSPISTSNATVLISTSQGDTAHITSPSGLARTFGSS